MTSRLARDARPPDPANGLLLAEHFQIAYATSDIDRARTLLGDRLGVRRFRRLEGTMPAGGTIRADLAWVGTVMYELIEAHGPGADLYMDRLPSTSDFCMKQHHLGFLICDQAQWDALIGEAGRQGWAIPYRNVNPLMEACFVDVPALGHYLEYLFPVQEGLDFLDAVPRN